MPQKNYISHYENLKNKWTDNERKLHEQLLIKHREAFDWVVKNANHLAATSAAGLMLLSTTPSIILTPMPPTFVQESVPRTNDLLISDLSNKLPNTIQPLSQAQAERIAAILTSRFGFSIMTELQGITLNTNYGYIGQEQHLARYPGDTLESQLPTSQDVQLYWSYGMAPGLGAYGYFAPSEQSMTDLDVAREKYYVAVQTFLSSGYNEHVAHYNNFFRYRKVLVVNPQSGKAIIADIADAGPAEWTGKSFGGSPEVMKYLGRVDGAQKGPVLIFFIDDASDKIPLGPVMIQ